MQNEVKREKNVNRGFANFFKETFRARDKSEYKEFFTRGMSGKEAPAKAEYGWMYVRVFVLFFSLFALVAFLISCTKNGIAVPTLYLWGGLFMNLTVAVFIYELNPERNLSFALFVFILIVGTACADFITMTGYYFCYPGNEWHAALWAAFLEEVAKAIPTIVAILIFKKKSPMLGFIIGAAIGAGFSISEDMGYIFIKYTYGLDSMVETAVGRAWTAVCTHTLWTAVVGWAFCKFKCKPYNPCFILVFVSSMALHFIWDIPIDAFVHIADLARCVGSAIAVSVIIVKEERRPYKVKANNTEIQLSIPMPQDCKAVQEHHVKRCSHTANVIASVTAVLVGITLVLWCAMPAEYVSVEKRFKDEGQFIEYVQGDKVFLTKWDKRFEDCLPDGEIKYAVLADGEYEYAFVCVEEEDGYKYDYTFEFYKDKETGENTGEVIGIGVTVGDENYFRLLRLEIPDEDSDEGYRYLTYTMVNSFRYCYYDADSNEYVVVLGWYSDDTARTVVSVFSVVILLIGTTAFAVLKIKSKKLRRKYNVG